MSAMRSFYAWFDVELDDIYIIDPGNCGLTSKFGKGVQLFYFQPHLVAFSEYTLLSF